MHLTYVVEHASIFLQHCIFMPYLFLTKYFSVLLCHKIYTNKNSKYARSLIFFTSPTPIEIIEGFHNNRKRGLTVTGYNFMGGYSAIHS